MLYFLWTLLNLGALIWFLIICFGALKLIRQEYGMAALVIFILGCLSFINNSVTNHKQTFPEEKNAVIEYQTIQENMFFHIDLMFVRPNDSLALTTPASTVKSGLVMGHEWKPGMTRVFLENGSWNYNVEGLHEWKFLGLTLYKEPIELKGVVTMK